MDTLSEVGGGFCSLCQSPVVAGEPTTRCPGCASVYHADCWRENTGCGLYGCGQVPETDKRGELEIPAGFWGKDTKACPACGKEIVAAAVRCRHCAATFQTAEPQSRMHYRVARDAATRQPGIRARVWWLFAGCALPFTSAVCGAIGIWWWSRNRDAIARQPPSVRGILHIALLLSAVQLGIVILALSLGALVRGR